MKLPVYKFDVDYFMHTFCLFARLVYCGNVILYNLHNKSQNPLTDQSQEPLHLDRKKTCYTSLS